MVAGIPPVLPPGYISLFQAIDCVDPGALQKGTDRARKDPDRFLESLDWVAVAQQGIADVPQLVSCTTRVEPRLATDLRVSRDGL